MAVPRPTWTHHWEIRVTHPMLITAFIKVLTWRSPAERLVRFESETLQFICNTLSWKPPSWGFQDDLIDSSIILKFSSIYIYSLCYFQMKPQLLAVIDIFKVSSSRHKSVMRMCILVKMIFLKWHKYMFPQMGLFSKVCNRS